MPTKHRKTRLQALIDQHGPEKGRRLYEAHLESIQARSREEKVRRAAGLTPVRH